MFAHQLTMEVLNKKLDDILSILSRIEDAMNRPCSPYSDISCMSDAMTPADIDTMMKTEEDTVIPKKNKGRAKSTPIAKPVPVKNEESVEKLVKSPVAENPLPPTAAVKNEEPAGKLVKSPAAEKFPKLAATFEPITYNAGSKGTQFVFCDVGGLFNYDIAGRNVWDAFLDIINDMECSVATIMWNRTPIFIWVIPSETTKIISVGKKSAIIESGCLGIVPYNVYSVARKHTNRKGIRVSIPAGADGVCPYVDDDVLHFGELSFTYQDVE